MRRVLVDERDGEWFAVTDHGSPIAHGPRDVVLHEALDYCRLGGLPEDPVSVEVRGPDGSWTRVASSPS